MRLLLKVLIFLCCFSISPLIQATEEQQADLDLPLDSTPQPLEASTEADGPTDETADDGSVASADTSPVADEQVSSDGTGGDSPLDELAPKEQSASTPPVLEEVTEKHPTPPKNGRTLGEKEARSGAMSDREQKEAVENRIGERVDIPFNMWRFGGKKKQPSFEAYMLTYYDKKRLRSILAVSIWGTLSLGAVAGGILMIANSYSYRCVISSTIDCKLITDGDRRAGGIILMVAGGASAIGFYAYGITTLILSKARKNRLKASSKNTKQAHRSVAFAGVSPIIGKDAKTAGGAILFTF